jgi:hypothetical protein
MFGRGHVKEGSIAGTCRRQFIEGVGDAPVVEIRPFTRKLIGLCKEIGLSDWLSIHTPNPFETIPNWKRWKSPHGSMTRYAVQIHEIAFAGGGKIHFWVDKLKL